MFSRRLSRPLLRRRFVARRRQEAYASANDGVMTWDELLKHMDDMNMKWRDAIKGSDHAGVFIRKCVFGCIRKLKSRRISAIVLQERRQAACTQDIIEDDLHNGNMDVSPKGSTSGKAIE